MKNFSSKMWIDTLLKVDTELESIYMSPRLHNLKNPTDELFYILLSNRSDPKRYHSVYKNLRKKYKPWTKLADASKEELENILRPIGLQKSRAAGLLSISKKIKTDFGAVSLQRLKKWSMEQAEEYLTSLPGVGQKTARCIMMYSLGYDVVPIDTHQFRVMTRLGLLPDDISVLKAQKFLDEFLPQNTARRLHVNVISHGRKICKPKKPLCHDCLLNDFCPTGNLK